MSAVAKLFVIGLRQIVRDGMLLLLVPAPFLMGAALRMLLPLAHSILAREMGFSLLPWYNLSDAFVMAMTPLLTATACAFLILDERDEGIGIYYGITPAGGRSYLLARLAVPMAWAFLSSVVVIWLFGLAVDTMAVIGDSWTTSLKADVVFDMTQEFSVEDQPMSVNTKMNVVTEMNLAK